MLFQVMFFLTSDTDYMKINSMKYAVLKLVRY